MVATALVRACLRDGKGGSPTTVLDDDAALDDRARQDVPVMAAVSHAVFLAEGPGSVGMRFFTSAGELPACGHGTVAALALLAQRAGKAEYETRVRAGGREFGGRAWRGDDTLWRAEFDPGPVTVSNFDADEQPSLLLALGIRVADLAAPIAVASVGRERLLVAVNDPADVAALHPDMPLLGDFTRRLGLLGCYVYAGSQDRYTARMFAPAIGVPEDIANANSTACLAAHLAGDGERGIAVDMGDSLGQPATVTATVRRGPDGPLVSVGGVAEVD